MNPAEFWQEMDGLLHDYDLLKHPYYRAWTAGELTLDDLREYAAEYYHHISSFPLYLREFARRLPNAELRHAVLQNLCDEIGVNNGEARAHHLIWLDFVAAIGVSLSDVFTWKASRVAPLIDVFFAIARNGEPPEVLAAMYVYEVQVPRVASFKASALRDIYGLKEKDCEYFVLHATADVAHAAVWREQIQKLLEEDCDQAEPALGSAGRAAKALWEALDGFQSTRIVLGKRASA
jgi:pyrroloquinoline-quinone synthase